LKKGGAISAPPLFYLPGKVINNKLAIFPSCKEGMPRRSKIDMLPQVIGAAGVVSHTFYCSLDILMDSPVLEPKDSSPNSEKMMD